MSEQRLEILKNNAAKMADKEKVAVIGLGYVGFPLSIVLAEQFDNVVGFDVSEHRVTTLKAGSDFTGEIEDARIAKSNLTITDDPDHLKDASFYIVTVPTPITKGKRPDLGPMRSASAVVGKYLSKGDVVVYESTVYPGVTEDYCGPLLEEASGLVAGVDFFLGYSPERINPGDKENPIEKITKIVSGDSAETLIRVSAIYDRIITAGIFEASSIKVAEGAKVLENTQRDINIALMNELAMICDRIGVATTDVIEAAATKWNFVKFQPGLVGGHCIGVDPYYLAALSEEVGHHPEVILSGRRLNDSMPSYVANTVLKKLVRRGGSIRKARIGVFGVTFKENVPDMRNSKSVELIEELESFGLNVLVHDPHVDVDEAGRSGLALQSIEDMKNLDAMVLTVAHREFMEDPAFLELLAADGILIDVKSSFLKRDRPEGIDYWSL